MIEKYNFVSIAEYGAISNVSRTIEALMENLRHYSIIAVDLFHNSVLEVNP